MPAESAHRYFAYGSNLSTAQMTRRCPDARDPRPAVLTGHDWLINERGVATIEPSDGGEVHGVVWQVSDHDLATLDSAEGVPVRYRRDRLDVQTPEGACPAWVYIDHRVEPGPPRPGYLERVLDGARQHGLPPRWIEFLQRWDPASWPQRRDTDGSAAPRSLSQLLADPAVREETTLRSTFGFLAIHGGGLEQMTDVIARRAADAADASLYVVHHPDRYPHHLSSALYDPQQSVRLAEFLDHVEVAVSLHGYGRRGRSRQLLAGGSNRVLAEHVSDHLAIPGHEVVTDLETIPRELRGLHPDNPVNRVRGGGTQLELTARVRGISPRSAVPSDDGLAPPTSALVQGLASAARTWFSR